ncbi:hypothetical protein AAMO2058_000902500 [Amorphochlora amoebiformis]
MCIGTSLPAHSSAFVVRARVVNATPAQVLHVMDIPAKKKRPKKKYSRSTKSKSSKPVKAKKPKRPKTAYNYFQLAEKSRMQTRDIGLLVHNEEFAKTIGHRWKSLDPVVRKMYQDMADKDKARYKRENQAYLRSLAGDMKAADAVQADSFFTSNKPKASKRAAPIAVSIPAKRAKSSAVKSEHKTAPSKNDLSEDPSFDFSLPPVLSPPSAFSPTTDRDALPPLEDDLDSSVASSPISPVNDANRPISPPLRLDEGVFNTFHVNDWDVGIGTVNPPALFDPALHTDFADCVFSPNW